MTPDIDVKEVIEDKKSEFNLRRFKIGDTPFELRPEKSLDATSTSKETFDAIRNEFKFREGSKVIFSYKSILNLYGYDDAQIQKFFFQRNWSNIPTVLNYTFSFNPFINIRNVSEMDGFFDLYHAYSDLLLTVPNIRFRKFMPEMDQEGKEKYVKRQIIDFNDYTRFVESAYDILNKRNNKPIFVPISFRMNMTEIKALIKHYLEKEYYYYWLDFDGATINQTRIGIIRNIYNIIRESGNYYKVIFYFTNIKREIQLNAKNEKSEASDVLSSTIGANLIGVNREPRRVIKITPPPPLPDSESNYKSRLLDSETYYYVRTHNPDLFSKFKYVPQNALILNNEFKTQADYFLENGSMVDFLNKKEMLTKYENGDILRHIITKSPLKTKISDFFLSSENPSTA